MRKPLLSARCVASIGFWGDILWFNRTMNKKLWILIIAIGVVSGILWLVTDALTDEAEAEVYLLEWGWETPKLQDIAQVEHLEALPFDGVVLDASTDRPYGWGMNTNLFIDESIPQAEFEQIWQAVEGIDWQHLQHNFLLMTIYPATVDWFDDFQPMLGNIEAWARLSHELGFEGIVFDTEQYAGVTIFDYTARPYRDQYTQEAYAEQAYERGRAVMQALNRGHPRLTVLFTFGLSTQFVLPESYRLLIPFIEGMLSAAIDGNRLVDGFEQAYRYFEQEEFDAARQWVTEQIPNQYTQNPTLYRQFVDLGFGLWLDHDCEGFSGVRCGYDADSFGNALTNAYTYSESYVWIWSQSINWYAPHEQTQEWIATIEDVRAITQAP